MDKKWMTLGIVGAITAAVIALGMSDVFLSPEEREALDNEQVSE